MITYPLKLPSPTARTSSARREHRGRIRVRKQTRTHLQLARIRTEACRAPGLAAFQTLPDTLRELHCALRHKPWHGRSAATKAEALPGSHSNHRTTASATK